MPFAAIAAADITRIACPKMRLRALVLSRMPSLLHSRDRILSSADERRIRASRPQIRSGEDTARCTRLPSRETVGEGATQNPVWTDNRVQFPQYNLWGIEI
jgi:hypothetical protein